MECKNIKIIMQMEGGKILEGEACADHIHILVNILPKISVSGFMGLLRCKSSQIIYE